MSLVGRAAQAAANVEWIDRRIVSTDDAAIAAEAAKYKLDVPFMRPPELAGDFATSIDMWKHAWVESERHYGERYDISVLLEPTSPLRRPEDIRRTVETLIQGDHEAAVTVSAAPAHFTPQKCLTVDDEGHMNIAFQILLPAFDYDLAHSGKGKSHGWTFFTTYNTEKSHTLKEVNASQNDKDFIAAVNWKKAEEYLAAGKAKNIPGRHFVNRYDEKTHMATSTEVKTVPVLTPEDCPGLVYFLPTPKSPHGVDVDPTGEYIIGSGKLSADLTAHSFTNMLSAIENEEFETIIESVPVLKYDKVVGGVVKKPGLGPLHTEFDNKGNAYTTFFISSNIVKWKVGTWEVLDKVPTYYSVGHLMIPGGDSKKPQGKYMVALNKITKDRYLPTGPEMNHSAQLYDISGDKMKLLLDFPTVGEPHYAQGISADRIVSKSKKFYKIEENEHPHRALGEGQTRVERSGNTVHVYMTSIRSHFAPDNIEGIRVGDEVYVHLTNLEQDFDVPHGLAIQGMNNAELLVMPGQTETLYWKPQFEGVFTFYCTDFCSALHQEMQGYIRVSPRGSRTPLSWSVGDESNI